jgi:hypothetical protein
VDPTKKSQGEHLRTEAAGVRRVIKSYFRLADPGNPDSSFHWIPDGFPTSQVGLAGDRHLSLCDGLIMTLIKARGDLEDPERAPAARALIEGFAQSVGRFDPRSKEARRELMVQALDTCEILAERQPEHFGDLGLRTVFAESLIRNSLPSVKLPAGVVTRAVERWGKKRGVEARDAAVRELARALGCDSASLPTMLRQARRRARVRWKQGRK